MELQTLVVVGGSSVSNLCDGLNQFPSPQKKGEKQNVGQNLTEIVDVFLSFISWLCRMNLLLVLPWIQVSFECYDSIWLLYMEKTFWCVYGRIDICDVGTWLAKRNLGGRTIRLFRMDKIVVNAAEFSIGW